MCQFLQDSLVEQAEDENQGALFILGILGILGEIPISKKYPPKTTMQRRYATGCNVEIFTIH